MGVELLPTFSTLLPRLLYAAAIQRFDFRLSDQARLTCKTDLLSGQTVVRALGIPVVPDDKLMVGKANEDGKTENTPLLDVSPRFADNASLWYYILAESQQAFVQDDTPIRPRGRRPPPRPTRRR